MLRKCGQSKIINREKRRWRRKNLKDASRRRQRSKRQCRFKENPEGINSKVHSTRRQLGLGLRGIGRRNRHRRNRHIRRRPQWRSIKTYKGPELMREDVDVKGEEAKSDGDG